MKIGIITAMPEEFSAAADALGDVTVSRPGGFRVGRRSSAEHEFMLVESGMAFGNAARATESLIADFHPELLISTGFCGGSAPELQAGDVVVAKKIIFVNDGGFEEMPIMLSGVGQTFVARQIATGNRVVEGVFVSTSTIESKKQLSGMLSGNYPNPVVEMESGAIALVAAENNIPLLAIRAVSDTADEELGFTLDEFCDPDMRRIRPYKVLLTIFRKPHIIPQLVRLSRSSRRAAESVTASLSDLLPLIKNSSGR
jgi:adenosylhomocysteine nucleosidase